MENNVSKLNYEFKDNKFCFGVDGDEDGNKVLVMKLNLGEALQEAVKRGDKVEGARLVDFKFEGPVMKLTLDTDKDGENLMELEVDMMEAFDEIKGKM